MAANPERFERIVGVVTPKVITYTHVRRATLNDDWKDAEIVSSLELEVEAVPELLTNGNEQISLAAYGLSKVLQERLSDEKNTGAKLAGYQEVYDNLVAGIWREAAQPRGSQINPIQAQAVAELQNISIAAAIALLQELDADKRKAVLTGEKVTSKVAELKEAAKAETTDTDLSDLLG